MNTPVHQCFVKDWFDHPSWWFDATRENDEYIRQKYEGLLDIEYDGYVAPLEKIILWDQLPRHIYRHESAAHIIQYFLQLAVDVALDTISDEEYMNSLSPQQWCFVMLPLRHTKELSHVFTVMRLAWKKLLSLRGIEKGEDRLIIKRFMKATYMRCPIEKYALIHTRHDHVDGDGDSDDVLGRDIAAKYAHILEERVENDSAVRDDDDHLIWAGVRGIMNTEKRRVILSLSGGVDSMVCSYVMSNVRALTSDWVAVHINYCNRKTAYEEEAFVRDWCKTMNIPLYVRRITEIQRAPCMENDMRDVYETYTRNVRYQAYKSVAKEVWGKGGDGGDGGDGDRYVVMMGHNKDDCLENIFTNIAHSDHYDNLLGMDRYVIQDGITFFRPLLEVTKEKIKAYACGNKIPHLPNSTPPWSQRGRIRGYVAPAMDDWDVRFVPGLFKLADRMTELHDVFDGYVNEFVGGFVGADGKADGRALVRKCGVEKLKMGSMFWRNVVAKLCGDVMVSERSLLNMQQRLAGGFTSRCNVLLQKNVAICFEKIDACGDTENIQVTVHYKR